MNDILRHDVPQNDIGQKPVIVREADVLSVNPKMKQQTTDI